MIKADKCPIGQDRNDHTGLKRLLFFPLVFSVFLSLIVVLTSLTNCVFDSLKMILHLLIHRIFCSPLKPATTLFSSRNATISKTIQSDSAKRAHSFCSPVQVVLNLISTSCRCLFEAQRGGLRFGETLPPLITVFLHGGAAVVDICRCSAPLVAQAAWGFMCPVSALLNPNIQLSAFG